LTQSGFCGTNDERVNEAVVLTVGTPRD